MRFGVSLHSPRSFTSSPGLNSVAAVGVSTAPETQTVTAANNDTLSSSAFIDLSSAGWRAKRFAP
ncbi:hypothetical protein [Phenylobacterium sp.]|uniref:hypothetical protein n=1 Tax=Phenylobacterium sp. TaxID=1871053 RepID=UPI003566A52C